MRVLLIRESTMSLKSPACPKCSHSMEQGFVMDYMEGARKVDQWARGAPKKSFWTGTKMPEDDLIPIGTFRCPVCGYLESYARTEYRPQ